MNNINYGIVYHTDYNKYDLGLSHPLIGNKPQKTIAFLKEKKLIEKLKLFTPEKATEEDLLRVHDLKYIERIKELSKEGGMLSFDTPAPAGIFEAASLAAGGTILAGEKLFHNFQCMVNPLAGFHHAGKSDSSGFCFLNDIAIVIEHLRNKYNIKRFQIVDLDVHHGNGTQDFYYNDPTVMNISFHQDGRTLYPGTGAIDKIGGEDAKGFTVNLPLPPGTGSVGYLKAFNEIIPPLVKEFNPELIIYQSGVDTHHSDPLADLCLTYQVYYHIARKMIDLSINSCNKLLVLMGGGYNSSACIKSYYNIVCGLLKKKEYIKEDEIPDNKIDDVNKLISELKNLLHPYWKI
jgi:acetoin utilization protein AcuC